MTIRTRFAPSPTGFLHIGNARTALFSYLFARHHQGEFLLRIEDTDKKRSTQEAIEVILRGMEWMGLDYDGDAIFQSQNETRHQEVAQALLENGNAYWCYCTPEELAALREEAQAAGEIFRYPGIWRDRDASEAPADITPTLRLKTPEKGSITIEDGIKGSVTVDYSEIDDMVLLRADGTPTYMLAVVVDDHDMGITHIMRGDDHFTNSFRQAAIYEALGWEIPQMSHLPLIHGKDGGKMSKRHGALGVHEYEAMGILPEALCNYLMRLGWSHGDDEIIAMQQAIEWFDGSHIGTSPSRFDQEKLLHLNAHYIKQASAESLLPLLEARYGVALTTQQKTWLSDGLDALKDRANTIPELAEAGRFYLHRPEYNEKAAGLVEEGSSIIADIATQIEALEDWEEEALDAIIKTYVKEHALKFPKVGMPLRAALTGSTNSPSVGHIMHVLGKEETLNRLQNL